MSVDPTASLERDKPNGPRSRKGAQTRQRLLDAAKSVFEDSGFLEARISDIAERAGLSHGSFYHYFDSKEQIFREVAEAVDEQLSAPLAGVILDPSSHAPPQERIRKGMRLHFESYRAEARMMGVIEQVSRYDPTLAAVRLERHVRDRAQVADSIRQLQRRGMVDASLDPGIAAAALGAMTWRFAEMLFVQDLVDIDLDDAIEQVSTLFINALGLPTEAD